MKKKQEYEDAIMGEHPETAGEKYQEYAKATAQCAVTGLEAGIQTELTVFDVAKPTPPTNIGAITKVVNKK